MAQQLAVPPALPEDPSSVPSTLSGILQLPLTLTQGSDILRPHGVPTCIWHMTTHANTNNLKIMFRASHGSTFIRNVCGSNVYI